MEPFCGDDKVHPGSTAVKLAEIASIARRVTEIRSGNKVDMYEDSRLLERCAVKGWVG